MNRNTLTRIHDEIYPKKIKDKPNQTDKDVHDVKNCTHEAKEKNDAQNIYIFSAYVQAV
jgi:hypothetical protein